MEQFNTESRCLNSDVEELQQHKTQLEDQQNRNKKAIDECTLREKQKLEENAQLKLEICSLQEKVSQLTQSSKGMKHTIERLEEQLHNALERERQNKKEIDEYKIRENKKLEDYAKLKNENERLLKRVVELNQNCESMTHKMKTTQEEARKEIAIQKQKYEDEKKKIPKKWWN